MQHRVELPADVTFDFQQTLQRLHQIRCKVSKYNEITRDFLDEIQLIQEHFEYLCYNNRLLAIICSGPKKKDWEQRLRDANDYLNNLDTFPGMQNYRKCLEDELAKVANNLEEITNEIHNIFTIKNRPLEAIDIFAGLYINQQVTPLHGNYAEAWEQAPMKLKLYCEQLANPLKASQLIKPKREKGMGQKAESQSIGKQLPQIPTAQPLQTGKQGQTGAQFSGQQQFAQAQQLPAQQYQTGQQFAEQQQMPSNLAPTAKQYQTGQQFPTAARTIEEQLPAQQYQTGQQFSQAQQLQRGQQQQLRAQEPPSSSDFGKQDLTAQQLPAQQYQTGQQFSQAQQFPTASKQALIADQPPIKQLQSSQQLPASQQLQTGKQGQLSTAQQFSSAEQLPLDKKPEKEFILDRGQAPAQTGYYQQQSM